VTQPIKVLHVQPLSTMPEMNVLHSMHVFVVDMIKKLIDSGDELYPTWIVVAKQDVIFIGTPWESEREKDATVSALRHTMRKFRARHYSFACETWTASYSEEEMAKRDTEDYVPPSNHPNCRDGLIVITCSATDHEMTTFDVKYDDSGPKVRRYLEELKGCQSGGGRMAELLRPTR
jgi:hypothetical protein